MMPISLLAHTLGTIFDSYEVIYLTKDVGITESQFSFSLSYLACIFLVAASIYYKLGDNHDFKHFIISSFIFGGYLLFFSIGSHLVHILISYTLLALGQTFMGIFTANYTQLNLDRTEMRNLSIYEDMIQSVSSTIVIIGIGLTKLDYTYLRVIYLCLTVVYFLVLIVMYAGYYKHMMKERIR